MKKKKLIIFDLDGVLIDSVANMELALKKTSLALNVDLRFSLYKKFLGLPFEKIMKKMGINKNIQKIKKTYSFFSKKNISKIKIKKKHLSQLKTLRKNYDFAVFTSKDRIRTNMILKKYRFFKHIISSDDVKKGKPNKEGINKILKNLKVQKNDCLYVGDSFYDYKAAKNSKVKYLHAKWGYEKNLSKKYSIKEISNLGSIKKFL